MPTKRKSPATRKPKKPAPRGAVNWPEAKQTYLYSDPHISMAAIAKSYKVSEATIRKRAAAERWTAERRKVWAEAEAKARADADSNLQEKFAEWDRKHLDAAEHLRILTLTELEANTRYNPKGEIIGIKQMNAKVKGFSSKVRRPTLTTTDLQRIKSVLRGIVSIERTVHGREVLKTEDINETRKRSPGNELMEEVTEALDGLSQEQVLAAMREIGGTQESEDECE